MFSGMRIIGVSSFSAVTFSLLSFFGMLSLLDTTAMFEMLPLEITRATIFMTTFSLLASLPIVTFPVTLSYLMSVRVASNETNSKSGLKLSITYTVASDRP